MTIDATFINAHRLMAVGTVVHFHPFPLVGFYSGDVGSPNRAAISAYAILLEWGEPVRRTMWPVAPFTG